MNSNDAKQEIICAYESKLAFMNIIEFMVPADAKPEFLRVKKLVEEMIDNLKSNPMETPKDIIQQIMFTLENGEAIRKCTETLKLKKSVNNPVNHN